MEKSNAFFNALRAGHHMTKPPLFARIPAYFDGITWRAADGEPLVAKSGTNAIFEVAEADIPEVDKPISEELTITQFLAAGSRLRVALNVPRLGALPNELIEGIVRDRSMHGVVEWSSEGWLSKDCFFVEAVLLQASARRYSKNEKRDGLLVHHRGGCLDRLSIGPIGLEHDILPEPATSLNRLLTMLSELYEVQRKSHTGSIYNQIFYKETNDRWYPLGFIRSGYEDYPESIAHRFWSAV